MSATRDGAPRALIADDEPRLASYLAEKLATAWPELQVAGIAANGAEALRLIEDHDPDILFLDIRMPGLTGLEVARRAADLVALHFPLGDREPGFRGQQVLDHLDHAGGLGRQAK